MQRTDLPLPFGGPSVASQPRKKVAKLRAAIRKLPPTREAGHDIVYVVGKLNHELVGGNRSHYGRRPIRPVD